MESPQSLARHLCAAATRWPQALALRTADRHWTYRQWLGEVAALAETIETSRRPLTASGASLDLARNAFACSLKNRPFQPVDRAMRAADAPLPAGIAIVIATSGSEGEPRGVMLSDASLDAAAAAANDHLSLLPGDLWLDCLPLHHIGGLSILWRCTRAGAGVLLHEGFAAEAVANSLASQPVTHLSLVPAMLARLLECGARPPGSLRHVVIGGAALSRVLHDRATATGWPLDPSYGLSETAAQVATYRASIVKAFVKGGQPWRERVEFGAAVTRQDFGTRMRSVLDRLCERGGVCHIWEHSWDLDKVGGWDVLDGFLRYAAQRLPP